jgi:tetratricopeptide (TPR) repeat protein
VASRRVVVSRHVGSHSPACKPVDGGRTPFFRGSYEGEAYKFDRFARKGAFSTQSKPAVTLKTGQARILYVRRQYTPALKLFQQVLQLNPYCLPDPRIGIGLCLWALNHREKAKAAWERSLEVVRWLCLPNRRHSLILFFHKEPFRVVGTTAPGA